MKHTNVYTKSAPLARLVRLMTCWALGFALPAILPAAASTVQGPDSYEVYISSDYTLLMHSTDPAVMAAVKQTPSNAINTAYNNPFIEIENKSSSASITEVQFSLPSGTDSAFDALKILQGPTDALKRLGLTGPFSTMVWGDKSQTVDIVLPTPLAPEGKLVFNVNLTPLTGFPNSNWTPGYNHIFFQDPPGSNANLRVFFTDLTNPPSDMLPSMTEMLSDNANTDQQPMLLQSSCCNANPTMFLGANFGSSSPVPEPSSVALLALGALPIAVPVWRKYKRGVKSRRS